VKVQFPSNRPSGRPSDDLRRAEERHGVAVERALVLDQEEEIEKYDKLGMISTVCRFDEQLTDALQIIRTTDVPRYRDIDHILICGLGGSAIGGELLGSYLGHDLGKPLFLNRNYQVPGFVNNKTLAIVCSYSGNTEETLTAFEEAVAAGAQIVCITSGGVLAGLAVDRGCPLISVPVGYAPRAAFGFGFVAMLRILARADLISDRLSEVEESIAWVRRRIGIYGVESPMQENPAKRLATRLYGRIPVIYGSEGRLGPIARRWAGQISENAKQLAFYNQLPEMNHNEIVGWEHPATWLPGLVPVFLRDHQDHPRVQARTEITRDLLERKVEGVVECWSDGSTWLERMWTLILFGDFASIYLALLNREDPTPVDIIEDFKARLNQS